MKVKNTIILVVFVLAGIIMLEDTFSAMTYDWSKFSGKIEK